MKARDSIWVLVSGIIITAASIFAAFMKQGLWYFPAVIGVWLFFDYFSSMKNKNTAIQLLAGNKIDFLRLYFLMFMLGCTIELIGRFLFKLWVYPFQTTLLLDLLGLLAYPFILISFREMYESLKIKIKNNYILLLVSMALGILIWEGTNLLVYSWIYSVHLILVILGWSILIGFPVWIYNKFLDKQK